MTIENVHWPEALDLKKSDCYIVYLMVPVCCFGVPGSKKEKSVPHLLLGTCSKPSPPYSLESIKDY